MMKAAKLSPEAMEVLASSLESSISKCDNTMSLDDVFAFGEMLKAEKRAKRVNKIFRRNTEQQTAEFEDHRNRSAELDNQLGDLYNKI